MTGQPLVEAEDLAKYFPVTGGLLGRRVADLRAVDGVSLHIARGETLGLVGESGCGKSTLGRLLIRLLEPTHGIVRFMGEDITRLGKRALRPLRRRMQIIFQDPFASLNPRLTVQGILDESLRTHGIGRSVQERRTRAAALLGLVGLSEKHLARYPHEFSGGQRQRIGIARALAVEPEFVMADEPISALDVSIRAQILNLLRDLQQRLGLTYLFIAHDLGAVRYLSDRVAVMYLGQLVEVASKSELFRQALHPYTEALLAAIPVPDPERYRERIVLAGDVPSPIAPPPGCRFHPRCPYAQQRCRTEEPVLRQVLPERWVRCHFSEDLYLGRRTTPLPH